jgi:hypothetical protein
MELKKRSGGSGSRSVETPSKILNTIGNNEYHVDGIEKLICKMLDRKQFLSRSAELEKITDALASVFKWDAGDIKVCDYMEIEVNLRIYGHPYQVIYKTLELLKGRNNTLTLLKLLLTGDMRSALGEKEIKRLEKLQEILEYSPPAELLDRIKKFVSPKVDSNGGAGPHHFTCLMSGVSENGGYNWQSVIYRVYNTPGCDGPEIMRTFDDRRRKTAFKLFKERYLEIEVAVEKYVDYYTDQLDEALALAKELHACYHHLLVLNRLTENQEE